MTRCISYIIPEFQPQVLDSLRQPIETGEVAIARANHRTTYPARFQLVAAMNPCRCGHASDPGFACRRQPNARCIAAYQARLSGPLIDRFDLRIDVPAVSAAAARARQAKRYAALGLGMVSTNAAAPGKVIEEVAKLDAPSLALFHQAAERMRLSARGFHRVLKLARTLADLADEEAIGRIHIAEALAYRGEIVEQSHAA